MKLTSIQFTTLFVSVVITLACLNQASHADIFVTQTQATFFSGTISKYTNSGEIIDPAIISGIPAPAGLALSGDHLFVANFLSPKNGDTGTIGPNYVTGTVGLYTTSGETIDDLLVTLAGPASFVAVSGDKLFVSNYAVSEYTTSGTTLNSLFLPMPDYPPTINSFSGIAISDNYLYAANSNGTIRQYSLDGTLINGALISGLNRPMGIALSGDKLFVANYNSGTIGEYKTSGEIVNASLISGLTSPVNLAVAGDNLYVVSGIGGTVGLYTTSGTPINPALITGLNNPFGILVTVPEPSSFVIGVLGLLGFATIARRLFHHQRVSHRP